MGICFEAAQQENNYLTQQNFITEVMKAWDSIPESVHSNIYNSIKARLHACIDASGGSTKY